MAGCCDGDGLNASGCFAIEDVACEFADGGLVVVFTGRQAEQLARSLDALKFAGCERDFKSGGAAGGIHESLNAFHGPFRESELREPLVQRAWCAADLICQPNAVFADFGEPIFDFFLVHRRQHESNSIQFNIFVDEINVIDYTLNHIDMKTSIFEELELPEDRRAAMSREAMRRGIPVNMLVKEWLLEKADQILASAQTTVLSQAKVA